MKQKFLNWFKNKPKVAKEEHNLNTNLANYLSKKSYKKIIMHYTGMMPKEITKILKINKKIWATLEGMGADLGGGVGCISSTVAKKKKIKKIYCIDAVKDVVTKCQFPVKKSILGKNHKKVISVFGSFDCIRLPNSSLDFCISWESMHHSMNVIKTLLEAKRVVKNHGWIIIVDRAHNNNTPQKEINRMLNVVYPEKFLKENCLPLDKVLTRKENGEHEYRYKEWERFFLKANLKIADSFIIREKYKIKKILNDNGLKEYLTDITLGQFQKSKVVYLLKVEK